MMINNYVAYYRGSTQKLQRDTTNDKNDFDIIRVCTFYILIYYLSSISALQENHRFLWSDSDLTDAEQSWEAGLAKRYYEKLFKEYCIVDLSQYKRNLYAMRWRTEAEVFAGKGQFECGNKHCQSKEALSSWEVCDFQTFLLGQRFLLQRKKDSCF
jgi:protein FRA10AC1